MRRVKDLLDGQDSQDRRRLRGIAVAVRPHADGKRFNAFVDGQLLGTHVKRTHAWTSIRGFYKNLNRNDI